MRTALRWFFEIALILLVLGGCTQSITWLGTLTTSNKSKRYRGAEYDYYYDNRYRNNSSTYRTVENDDEEEEEIKPLPNDYYMYP